MYKMLRIKIVSIKLHVPGLSKGEATSMYLRSKNSYSESIDSGTSPNKVWLDTMVKGIYERGKGKNFIRRRKAFLLVQII